MKLVVIGHNGQLGWELCRLGSGHGFECVGCDLPTFDITDPSHVKSLLAGVGEGIVVNAAAYTAVDQAETDRTTAFAVNATGPGLLASACRERNLPLIHISTDYVFNGDKKTDYTEEDIVSPMCIYGESKAQGESAVREGLSEHLIIRTAWLYGVHGNNFVKTMLRLGKEREVLRVVSDQVGCPTDAMDLAEAVMRACRMFRDHGKLPWGTYHYCGAGHTSWHGLAEAVFQFAKGRFPLKVTQVQAITTSEYPTAACRPARSVLDCSKMDAAFHLERRPWMDSLKDMMIRLRAIGGTE